MKTKMKVILFLLSFFIANGSVYGADITNITPKDLQNINFEITPTPSLSNWDISWEIKVLKDLQIVSSSKDFKDSNKIIINLKDRLITNRSYNLLSVFWVDWNIDFTIWDELTLLDIKNPNNIPAIQWISRILILDPMTIEVYFNAPIDATEFEFKLFRESLVNTITNSGSTLSIDLNDTLDKSSNYILMVISLSNKYWIDIKFDQEIYDFTTSATLWDKQVVNTNVGAPIVNDTQVVKEKSMSWELSNVALNSAVTPKSWPETGVLIFLTLMVNVFLIARRKFSK